MLARCFDTTNGGLGAGDIDKFSNPDTISSNAG